MADDEACILGEWSRRNVLMASARNGIEGEDSETGYTTTLHRSQHPRRRRSRRRLNLSTIAYALLAGSIQTSAAACISLAESTQCPAFKAASISNDAANVGFYPFLADVTSVGSFDSGIKSYIQNGFAQIKYQQLFGCSKFKASDSSKFYARYTTSSLCSAIVQSSIGACGLTGRAARPLCAQSCATYAESEQEIVMSNVCGNFGDNALNQIRADFTNCALPADSLSQACIMAEQNQPNNCGYNSNLAGLCSYCAASSPNATDSCCVFSDTETRCNGVKLPVVATSALRPVTMTGTGSATSSATARATGGAVGNQGTSPGLTGGQIAGIVIGSILGALLLLGLVIAGCLLAKRRREGGQQTSIFNQPTPTRGAQMAYNDGARDQERGITALPPTRVARMSALEGPARKNQGPYNPYAEESEDSPDSDYVAARGAPPKRSASQMSNSPIGAIGAVGRGTGDDTSPSSNPDDTSPESQGQSEQLAFFKDYYSQDEIHPSDLVATLWAYEPRAADEFHLERGDMIKVIGIWDDGWATGVRARLKAEDWRPDDKVARDSGMSSSSDALRTATAEGGEVKAFPLVCVCLPQHWRKTIEGESTEGSGPPDMP